MSDETLLDEPVEELFGIGAEEEPPDHRANTSSDRPGPFFNPSGSPTKPKERRTRRIPPMPKDGLVKPLTDLYTVIGALVYGVDQECGSAILNSSEQCASALNELAKQNGTVRRVLIGLVQTNAWGAVVAAHAPIVMAVASHHLNFQLAEPVIVDPSTNGQAHAT